MLSIPSSFKWKSHRHRQLHINYAQVQNSWKNSDPMMALKFDQNHQIVMNWAITQNLKAHSVTDASLDTPISSLALPLLGQKRTT